MKKQDIHTFADDIIKKLVNTGFTISPDMRAAFNEGWSVVLGKGKTFMAIWTDEGRHEAAGYLYIDLHFSVFDTAALHGMAMKFAYDTGLDCRELVEYDTQVIRLWNIFGSTRDGDWWVEDVGEVTAARAKRKRRFFNNNSSTELEYLEVTDRLFKMARMLKGFKNVRRDDLRVMRIHFRNWDGTWESQYTFKKYSSLTDAEVHFNATNRPDHVYTVC